MKGTKKTQRIILAIAFVLVLAGFCLVAAQLADLIEPIYLFGKLNLGIALIIAGGVLTFFAPKPAGKKKKYKGY